MMFTKKSYHSLHAILIGILTFSGVMAETYYEGRRLVRKIGHHDLSKYNGSNYQSFDPSIVKPNDVVLLVTAYKSNNLALRDFMEFIHPQIKNQYVLMLWGCHYCSSFRSYMKMVHDKKIKFIITTHPFIQHHKILPIPVGLSQKHNDSSQDDLIDRLFTRPKTRLLYFPSMTMNIHPERGIVRQIFERTNYCYFGSPMSYNNYMTEMADFKFVFSPRGEGEDCFRTMEAIAVGAIPILKNNLTNRVLYKNMPVLLVNDWHEINEDFLQKKYREIKSSYKNNEYRRRLTLEFWVKTINKLRNTHYKIRFEY